MDNGYGKSQAALLLCKKIEEGRRTNPIVIWQVNGYSSNGLMKNQLAYGLMQTAMKDSQCKQIVFQKHSKGRLLKQCSRAGGYGKDRLFCKQHSRGI